MGEVRQLQITQNPTAEQLVAFYGLHNLSNLPHVTIDRALTVPSVFAAVAFLQRTLANLDLFAFRRTDNGDQRLGGRLGQIVSEAPNNEWNAVAMRKYFWGQVFKRGRGLLFIERVNGQPRALYPMDASNTSVRIDSLGRKTYVFGQVSHPARDIIDVPFMLKDDQCSTYSPISRGSKAIQLAIAMNDYGSHFFAGGGIPPMALQGPMPTGQDAMNRAMQDMHASIDTAKNSEKPVFMIPPGYELKQVGFDPDKGQMTEAKRLQNEEIARLFQLPPLFLQDLTHGTYSNTEQQDLHLTKHLIAQWAGEFEQEMNLKLFGPTNSKRFVRHDLQSLMRGDLKSLMEGLATGVQNSLMKPNEGRKRLSLPDDPDGDKLMIQGATVPVGSQGGQNEN